MRGIATPGAAVVTVGDELVLGERDDENGTWMLKTLNERGCSATIALKLPDDVGIIAAWIAQLKGEKYNPIFVSGGIGGTHDDCTRAGIAAGLGVELVEHPECLEILSARYGERFTEQRRRMAWLPAGCDLIANAGGAPGFCLHGVFAFPGFPTMLQPMFDDVLSNWLQRAGDSPRMVEEAVLPVPEGDIAVAVEEFAASFPNVRVGIYPSVFNPGREVLLRLRRPPEEDAAGLAFAALLQRLRREIRE